MRWTVILAWTLLLAAAPVHGAAAPAARPHRNPAPSLAKRAPPSKLAAAVTAMKALMRDRERRRYHHNWERGIAAILAAARGKEAAQGWLEASRARYALYRWSANEADRDKALLLATRAARAGSREARELAAAIRREAGDDVVEVARSRTRAPAPKPAAPAPRDPPPAEDEDSPPDPSLAAALADLAAASDVPTLRLGEDGSQGPAEVAEVRSWASGDYSRVAVYLSHWVGWQKLELPAEGGQPRRLAFDFRPATLSGRALSRGVAGPQIDRVRAAQNAEDTVRVVLDLPGSDGAEVFALDDPPRLVIDVGNRPSTSTPPSASATPAAPPVAPPSVPEEVGARPVHRIVVDAGHGGHDPGAIGRRGLREKVVALEIAKKVAVDLEKEGFEVILTRSDDRFLALEERTALANTARADLFVSIHANANPRRTRTGIETYFLNVTDDRYAARLAARENGADLEEEAPADEPGSDVRRRILTDLNAKASAGTSHQLADLVQAEVCRTVRSRFGDVRDLGVKSALFYVLLGARMPAVLVETGFISNAAEEQRLGTAAYRTEVAGAITRAIRAYAKDDRRVAAAR